MDSGSIVEEGTMIRYWKNRVVSIKNYMKRSLLSQKLKFKLSLFELF